MDISDDKNAEICILKRVLGAAKITSIQLLPEKSRKKYEAIYKAFMDWRIGRKVNSFSENVLLAYFGELSQKYKSSSLWAHYSMLKSTLSINNSINIEKYLKLRAFLKRKGEGYRPKKAKTFTPEEINTFINEAPDNIYLATKVALIMGVMGACRANELHSMNIEDYQDLGSATLVTVPNTKTNGLRKFAITGLFYRICKKYVDLRPEILKSSSSFFLNYQNGKCTVQKIGINKFGAMGKQIAKFLKLPNPEIYTGHTFRKSSATLLVDGDITALERHGGWKSTSEVEEYIDESMKNNLYMANKIIQPVQQTTSSYIRQTSAVNENNNSTPSVQQQNTQKASTINVNINSIPSIHFTNCSNFTINFITNNDNII